MVTYSSTNGYGLANHIEENDKQASTNSLTFAAMDPKKGGKQMYDLVYEPLDGNGDIVTKSSATVEWF